MTDQQPYPDAPEDERQLDPAVVEAARDLQQRTAKLLDCQETLVAAKGDGDVVGAAGRLEAALGGLQAAVGRLAQAKAAQ